VEHEPQQGYPSSDTAPDSLLQRVTIRHLREEDLPGLEWDGEFIHFRRLYREIYESTRRGNAIMWVAFLDGVGVIGQLFVQLNSARHELANGESRAYIYGFRIRQNYRRMGLGTRIMAAAERELAQRGFKWVTLNVSRENEEAIRLYRRCGYRIVAREAGRWSYIDHLGKRREVHEPSWRMEKKLDPSG
jgi:ribosomal protein S18 acetylase RimI-like enzyme